MDTVNWGIIGCGNVTEKKSGPAFQKARRSRLVAVMRRDAAKARDYASRHSVPRWYDDARKLISDRQVNAVYIATPPVEHKNYTLLCAAAGLPVYVEKPMARFHPECREMIRACADAGVPLYVAYYRRALPKFIKIRELVQSGSIGAPRLVHSTLVQKPLSLDPPSGELPWRVLPQISGGGLFLDLASHQLDILDFILGPLRSVRGTACNQAGLYPAEDTVTGSFSFASGCQGTGAWCFCGNTDIDWNEIVGSRGSISFSTFGNDPVILTLEGKEKKLYFEKPEHIQQPLIQTIVDELTGKGRCPSTGKSGARTSRVMDKILRSWRRDKGLDY
ncbi:MAG: Gfo/Idh/MocA family oxidoreductase [Candidatus Krumholzibacteriota bacterium]|nr:Gfo/Idh/MocA family oxidoreductase [Candidatus Krumholzibacteriota bacterium]